MATSRVFIANIGEDLTTIKLSNNDKVYLLYDKDSEEPQISISTFNILKNIKASIEFKPVDIDGIDAFVTALYIKESLNKNTVEILTEISLNKDHIKESYEEIFGSNSKQSKTRERAKKSERKKSAKDSFSSEVPTLSEENVEIKSEPFSMPKPAKEDVDSSNIDALDIYMNRLAEINGDLSMHANHIREAFLLKKSEHIEFEEGIKTIAGESNGTKITSLLGNNISEIEELALAFDD